MEEKGAVWMEMEIIWVVLSLGGVGCFRYVWVGGGGEERSKGRSGQIIGDCEGWVDRDHREPEGDIRVV